MSTKKVVLESHHVLYAVKRHLPSGSSGFKVVYRNHTHPELSMDTTDDAISFQHRNDAVKWIVAQIDDRTRDHRREEMDHITFDIVREGVSKVSQPLHINMGWQPREQWVN